MPEGVAAADGTVIGQAVYDDQDQAPPPGPGAEKGWTWSRTSRRWQPRQRGPVLWDEGPRADDGGPDDTEAAATGELQQRDPAPGWQSETRPIETFQVTTEVRADVKALIALAYTVPGETLPLLDPYCFGPLADKQTGTGIIDAVTDIVCGSPRVAKWAASASGLMPWIKLGMALKPVMVAAFHHHVLKDVKTKVDRKAKTVEITQQDWSQYSAA
jgi:hypothetical protein